MLRQAGRSLLPVGVTRVHGVFERGALVACCNQNGVEIARGLINYNAQDAAKIVGLSSAAIEQTLGYVDEPEMIHRDNMVIF